MTNLINGLLMQALTIWVIFGQRTMASPTERERGYRWVGCWASGRPNMYQGFLHLTEFSFRYKHVPNQGN